MTERLANTIVRGAMQDVEKVRFERLRFVRTAEIQGNAHDDGELMRVCCHVILDEGIELSRRIETLRKYDRCLGQEQTIYSIQDLERAVDEIKLGRGMASHVKQRNRAINNRTVNVENLSDDQVMIYVELKGEDVDTIRMSYVLTQITKGEKPVGVEIGCYDEDMEKREINDYVMNAINLYDNKTLRSVTEAIVGVHLFGMQR